MTFKSLAALSLIVAALVVRSAPASPLNDFKKQQVAFNAFINQETVRITQVGFAKAKRQIKEFSYDESLRCSIDGSDMTSACIGTCVYDIGYHERSISCLGSWVAVASARLADGSVCKVDITVTRRSDDQEAWGDSRPTDNGVPYKINETVNCIRAGKKLKTFTILTWWYQDPKPGFLNFQVGIDIE